MLFSFTNFFPEFLLFKISPLNDSQLFLSQFSLGSIISELKTEQNRAYYRAGLYMTELVMAESIRVYLEKEDVEKAVLKKGDYLVPKSNLGAENVDPAANYGQGSQDQIFTGDFPRYYSRLPKRRWNFCCLCLMWTLYFLLLLIVATVIAAAIIYSVFQPRIPKYSVDKFEITNYALSRDNTISSQIGMVVRVRNPNGKIGIDYLQSSYLGVFYSGIELCRGKLPAFYQGHGNTDNLNVNLTGSNVQIGNEMVTTLQRHQENIHLRLKADVPVKIEFGKLKTMKITFRLRCDLVVDRLDENTSVSRKKCRVKR